MSASPVIALRRAMRAHLGADAGLLAALGGAKLFDETPRNAEPPYVLFADVQMRDWSTSESRGAEQLFILSVVSTQRGTRETHDIAHILTDLLDGASLVLEGHHLVDLRFIASDAKREHNGRFARVDLRFRAVTESA